MNQTVPVFLGAFLLSTTSFAQTIKENFESNPSALSAQCWQFKDVEHATKASGSAYVINGDGSLYSNPPVNDNSFRTVATPYLDVTASSFSLSFDYRLTDKLKNGATRIIVVGLLDKSGRFTRLDSLTLDIKEPASKQTFSITNDDFKTKDVQDGVYRVMIKLGGTGGDGNARLAIDDLTIGAAYHYATFCNPAPVAENDKYNDGIKGANYYGQFSVLNNDHDVDQENMTAVLVDGSPDGTVELNGDGTFTFKPNEGFTGTSTSFTYRAIDKGFDPANSNTATVNIEFKESDGLALSLIDFNGKINNGKAQLNWILGLNELIDQIIVEKSVNGGAYSTAALIVPKATLGEESYEYAEPATGSRLMYRLKLLHKKGNEEYSAVINLTSKHSEGAQQLTITGNPVVSSLVFNYTTSSQEAIQVSIYNAYGVRSYVGTLEANKGLNRYTLTAVNSLQPGMYVLTLTNNKGESISSLFIKK